MSTRAPVTSGNTAELELCLVWHSPRLSFGGGLKEYRRFYTRHWSGPRAGPEMCQHALLSYPAWEEEIEAWQAPTLDRPDLPDWFKVDLKFGLKMSSLIRSIKKEVAEVEFQEGLAVLEKMGKSILNKEI